MVGMTMKKSCLIWVCIFLAMVTATCGNVSKKKAWTVAPWDKPYLYVNNLTFTEETIQQKREGCEITVAYPVISGLRNRKAQEAINRQFRDYAVRFAEKQTVTEAGNRLFYRHSHWYLAANYNNVLCIRFYSFEQTKDDSQHRTETFLYDLNTSRRLRLEDLFVGGTDYVKIISNAIKEDILRQNFEEEYFYRPFDRIEKEQPFSLTDSALIIDLPYNNPYIAGGMSLSFTIPLAKLGAAIDVFSKYLQGRSLYENQTGKKHMLPGRVTIHAKSIVKEGQGYSLRTTYEEFANIPNKELQEMLNRRFAEEAASFMDGTDFIRKAEKLYREDNSRSTHKSKNIGVTANYANVLCITDYEVVWCTWSEQSEESRRAYIYDTVSGRPLALKDLFTEGADYQSVISAHIRRNIEELQLKMARPFTGISEDTQFYLDGQNLIIYSLHENDFSDQLFMIPFDAFGDMLIFYQ